VPEFVGELFTLDREGDRNDDLGESPAVAIASDAARVAEPVPRIDRPPADSAYAGAAGNDGDEMVAVRLTELED
jgi:hypothetical protein